MDFPPIIERELRVARRKKRALRTRWWMACVTGLATLFFLLINWLGNSRQGGRELFELLILLGVVVAVVQTPQMTADLFSQERRNNTLGLIFLTGMTAFEVFVSKLLSAALIVCNNLLAMFPFLSVPFLLGGVSFSQFVGAACFLPNLMLFTLSLSVLASVLCDDDSTAIILVAALGGVICLALPAIYEGGKLFGGSPGLPAPWLLLSPAYGPYMVHRAFQVGSPAEFWINSAVTCGWSIVALVSAAWVLGRTWKDRPESASTLGRRRHWRAWQRGTPAWRLALRRRWLDDTPIVWLCACDRHSVVLSWISLAAIVALWLISFMAWPRGWLTVGNVYLTAILINAAVVFVVAHTAGKRLAQDRSSGALELLLTTPLWVDEIVDGLRLALIVQFRPVLQVALALNLALLAAGLTARDWSLGALCVYVLTWVLLLVWTRMALIQTVLRRVWIGLNTGRARFAALGSSSSRWVWFVLIFNASALPGMFSGFPRGNLFEFLVIGVFLIVSLLWAGWSREVEKKLNQIKDDFRIIARSPVPEPNDPRLKQWDQTRRFPLRRFEFDSVRRDRR